MCLGGGGGDGGYAERQAQMKAEQDRAIAEINAMFGKGDGKPIYQQRTVPGGATGEMRYDGDMATPVYAQEQTVNDLTGYDTGIRDKNAAEREKLYGTIRDDSEARLLDRLGEDRSDAERGVRFQLARQGLAGGSADIDQGQELLEKFQEGSLEARTAATSAANDARSADEKTRVSLINNIRSGMAQNDAMSAAFAGMQNNANTARDSAMSTDIGNFFNDLTMLNNQKAFRQSMDGAVQRAGGGNMYGTASSGGNNGRIS